MVNKIENFCVNSFTQKLPLHEAMQHSLELTNLTFSWILIKPSYFCCVLDVVNSMKGYSGLYRSLSLCHLNFWGNKVIHDFLFFFIVIVFVLVWFLRVLTIFLVWSKHWTCLVVDEVLSTHPENEKTAERLRYRNAKPLHKWAENLNFHRCWRQFFFLRHLEETKRC